MIDLAAAPYPRFGGDHAWGIAAQNPPHLGTPRPQPDPWGRRVARWGDAYTARFCGTSIGKNSTPERCTGWG